MNGYDVYTTDLQIDDDGKTMQVMVSVSPDGACIATRAHRGSTWGPQVPMEHDHYQPSGLDEFAP